MTIKQKKLLLGYSYYSMELREIEEICEELEKDIRNVMEEKYPDYYKTPEPETKKKNNKDQVKDIVEEEIIETEIKTNNKNLKNIYRKIAIKTHPDKNTEYSSYFEEAAAAYAEKDVGKILQIAGELNISLPELSNETIQTLENNIQDLKTKINEKKNTTAWAWYLAKNDEEKDNILKYIIKSKGATP